MDQQDYNLCIIVPAYNEAPVIAEVLQNLFITLNYVSNLEIIVIDDGSTDGTEVIAKNCGVTVVRHCINRGLGGALGTGFHVALLRGADIAVTFDADGQHRPEDIEALIAPILQNTADVVIGSRMIDHDGMPFIRVILNKCANIATKILFRIEVTDTQSGLRALSSNAIQKINIHTNRMEVSSELLAEVSRNKLRITEITIPSIYTEYSLHKGQKNLNGISILIKLILRKLMR